MHSEITSFQSKDMRFGLKIPDAQLNSIYEMCASSSNKETGGILIGYYSDNLSWATITKATAPPLGSICCAFSFIREGKTLLHLLDKLWKKQQYYIGEWHFHPNASSTPSNADRETMKSLASTKSIHCPEPILLIIGGNCKEWNLHCSVFVNGQEIVLFPAEHVG